jgi:hypothetical protein
MKLLTRSLFAALAVAFGFSGASFGYEGVTMTAAESYLGGGDCGCASACGDVCGGCGCASDCCGCCDDGGLLGGWGLFGEAELLFLRYHRADGVRVGSDPGESGEFDFEPAYRLSAGVMAPGGLGFRTRYFEYDHAENIGDGILDVNTYTIDFELFEAFALNQNWAMEISGGVRYCNFKETMLDEEVAGQLLGDFREVGFNGAGLVTGLEARRAIGGIGLLYARTRAAVVQDDKTVIQASNVVVPVVNQSVRLVDTTGGMLELAVGGEVNYALDGGAVLFARSGLEWQNWWNFSNEFDFLTGEDFFDDATDVGFGGFTFSLGMSY